MRDKAVHRRSRTAKTLSLRGLASSVKVNHLSTPELIASALREAIVSGAIQAGVQLRQNEVATNFGVSVIPVREALRQLEAQGFVIFRRNRGAVVAEISLDEISELFDIRVALETMLIRQAIARLTDADFHKAEKHLRALDKEADVNKWGQWNWLFHEALYSAAGRGRTLEILRNLHSHIDRLLRLQMSLAGGKKKSHREHSAILAACRQGDADRAAEVLGRHIRGVADIILRFATKQERATGRLETGHSA